MRFLLDQGLPRGCAEILRRAAWDVIHVAEIGMAAASDPAILARAAGDGRVVITLDADFHAILALSSSSGPSVLRIRVEGLRAEAMARLIEVAVIACEGDLERGAVTKGAAYGSPPEAIAWYRGSSGGTTHPVGEKVPNPWGCFDKLGNVWEWCADTWNPYTVDSAVDPAPSSTGILRVIRGGSWGGYARDVRASYRSRYNPASRSDDLGFRLARGRAPSPGAEPKGRSPRV